MSRSNVASSVRCDTGSFCECASPPRGCNETCGSPSKRPLCVVFEEGSVLSHLNRQTSHGAILGS